MKEKLRLLVTGATGVYGGHFAQYALSRGHDVFSISHNARPHDTASALGIRDRITWARGDIRDTNFLSLVLAENDIQAVAHFAAKPLVRTGTLIAEPIFSVNAMGTVALLDAVKQVAAKRKIHFLHVSTDKVYGNAGDRPYTEEMPLMGSSIYEASKIAAEVACRAYHSHGLVPHLVISRSCNVVGAADFTWRLVGNTVRQFVSNKAARVYSHAQYVREYLDARSAVEAQYELMMRADESEYNGQAFNIGSGEQYTQEQVIEIIRRDHFPEGQVIRVEPPAQHLIEVAYQKMDTRKIERTLGWKPKRTFRDAVADVAAFWKAHRELAPWSML